MTVRGQEFMQPPLSVRGEAWRTKSLEWTEDDSPAVGLPYSRTGMEWTDGTPATDSFPYFGDVYPHRLRLKDLKDLL